MNYFQVWVASLSAGFFVMAVQWYLARDIVRFIHKKMKEDKERDSQ